MENRRLRHCCGRPMTTLRTGKVLGLGTIIVFTLAIGVDVLLGAFAETARVGSREAVRLGLLYISQPGFIAWMCT
jgi:hypothetical protein